jgi:cell division protein FtsW (lipid II flippase)
MLAMLHGRLIAVRICMVGAALGLVAVGIVTIYAVGHPAEASPAADTAKLAGLWKRQLVFAGAAIAGFIAVNLVNYRRLGEFSYWTYGIIILLLVLLLTDKVVDLPFVPKINNVHQWIRVGTSSRYVLVQPSEFCKLAYILALGWYLRYRSNYHSFRALIGPFALTVLPMVLILLEPDLGTVMLMMPILFTMVFVAGAKVKHLAMVLILAVLVSPLLWYKMSPNQRTRISAVLLQGKWVQKQAEKHPQIGQILVGGKFSVKQWNNDWGYHLLRSKFAIASGGAAGYGFGRGPFIKYDFLPYRYNDFIFATIAHQWGFAGCLGLFGLYAIIIACALEIASYNIDPFGRLIAVGIIAMFIVEILVNTCMTVGLMPITGLTLPLVSYGGSSLVVNLASVGLLNNVGRGRPFTVAPKPFEQEQQ